MRGTVVKLLKRIELKTKTDIRILKYRWNLLNHKQRGEMRKRAKTL